MRSELMPSGYDLVLQKFATKSVVAENLPRIMLRHQWVTNRLCKKHYRPYITHQHRRFVLATQPLSCNRGNIIVGEKIQHLTLLLCNTAVSSCESSTTVIEQQASQVLAKGNTLFSARSCEQFSMYTCSDF